MATEAGTKIQFRSEMPDVKRYDLEIRRAIPIMKEITAEAIFENCHHLLLCSVMPEAMRRQAAGTAGSR